MDTGPDGGETRPGQKLSRRRGAGKTNISIVKVEVIALGFGVSLSRLLSKV
jgi:hypothetical protein